VLANCMLFNETTQALNKTKVATRETVRL